MSASERTHMFVMISERCVTNLGDDNNYNTKHSSISETNRVLNLLSMSSEITSFYHGYIKKFRNELWIFLNKIN